jgi:Dockerin type I domain/Bacterial Ig-like domain
MKRRSVNGVMTATLVLFLFSGAALAQLPGDLDGDGEVGLADVGAFVDCMNGPDGGSAPACDPGNFDLNPDTDIDLRDFAGFQARFGFGQGPPQIVRFSPAPGEWVVDDLGLTEVTVGFSEPVVVPSDPAEAVSVWGLVSGTVTGFITSYDPDTFVLTVSFAEALRGDQITVVVDYTIEDLAGNPLDGEIQNPKNASLPSGNNVNGGQGVFRIHVLQGDANRDGVVDAADETLVDNSLNQCAGDPGFDAMADLNTDGCVDVTDADIVTAASGNELSVTDGTPPVVVGLIEPSGDQQEFDIVEVGFSEIIIGALINEHTCFLVDANGNIVVPAFGVQTGFGNSAIYTFIPPLTGCETYTINVSNAMADSSGELLAAPGPLVCP